LHRHDIARVACDIRAARRGEFGNFTIKRARPFQQSQLGHLWALSRYSSEPRIDIRQYGLTQTKLFANPTLDGIAQDGSAGGFLADHHPEAGTRGALRVAINRNNVIRSSIDPQILPTLRSRFQRAHEVIRL
jgi:hypothetical protein